MTDPAYAAQQPTYAPPRRSSSAALMFLTGGLAAACTAGALVLGSQPACHEVPRPPTDTHVCDGLYYESSRASCRDRLRTSDAHYPPPSICTVSPMVLPLGVGGGVAGLAFLGLAGSAVVRRRDTIAASAATAWDRYQAAAPARAEANRKARENIGRVAGAAAATAANAAEAFRERRAERDVPPSASYPDDVHDYPDFEPMADPASDAPTVTDTTVPTDNAASDGGGWGF
ncbi:hypothetical protein [Mycolicibacter arupensis]|uniref:Uncharacterized protein n=1 Tax=Mycolicibacter arupensis TaxID=342002 RepID=A0A5C7Y2Y4_9MYCO|nr:hypothetical protein [Mycolicibacter arupensis]TXI55916.1 MAG: hypothetical protein E6Q54_11860 [Mycolicibacter arupensis]